MKIISPFQDYYDNAVHPTQVDQRIRFIRKTKSVPFDFTGSLNDVSIGDDIYYHVKTTYRGNDEYTDIHLRTALLTIGNKAFQIMVPAYIDTEEKDFPPHRNGLALPPWGAGNKETFEKLAKAYINHDGHSIVELSEREPYQTPRWLLRYKRGPRDNEEKFQYIGPLDLDTNALCMHYQTPTLLIGKFKDKDAKYGTTSKRRVIINPPLRAFNMINVIDPYQTWQEISMWIGGIMPGAQSPMVEISDISKIEKHGFDKKISFRKRKEV